MTAKDDTGLPTPPEGRKWVVKRWVSWDDSEFMNLKVGAKLAVYLASGWSDHTYSIDPHARAYRSGRSIRAAAFRALRRHERDERRRERERLHEPSDRSMARYYARKAAEKAREELKDAKVSNYTGVYPPKKLGA